MGQKLIDADAVAVDFKNEVLGAILSARPNSIALHAAALHAPSGAVMLAGSSGHGKTTLAALLNAYGWPSIADDIVLLESDSSRIQGLALAYREARQLVCSAGQVSGFRSTSSAFEARRAYGKIYCALFCCGYRRRIAGVDGGVSTICVRARLNVAPRQQNNGFG